MLLYLFLHENIRFGCSLEFSQLSNTNPLHRLQCVSNEQHIICLEEILMPNQIIDWEVIFMKIRNIVFLGEMTIVSFN